MNHYLNHWEVIPIPISISAFPEAVPLSLNSFPFRQKYLLEIS